jgi:ABC-type polysaccharide transport system permease subunit
MQKQMSVSTEIKKNKLRLSKGNTLLLMILPCLVLVFMFNYVPLFGWIFAFFDYKPGNGLNKTPFVGFEHFVEMFVDGGNLARVLTNTLALSFLVFLLHPCLSYWQYFCRRSEAFDSRK